MKKIIATGKGGVGKTTTLSVLSMLMARSGKKIIVFDTDPSMNLALTFGIPYDNITSITEDKGHISHDLDEKGIRESGYSILMDHSAVTSDGIRIVIMGAILQGGSGCLCSAISLIRILLEYVEESEEYDVAIVDSQAGPEVLGRGLANSFDLNIILTEPTAKSAEVSRQVLGLAMDLGVKDNLLVVNKIDYPEDVGFTSKIVGMESYKALGVRFDRDVVEADRLGKLLLDMYPGSNALLDIKEVWKRVETTIGV